MVDEYGIKQALLGELSNLQNAYNNGRQAAVVGQKALKQLHKQSYEALKIQLARWAYPGGRLTSRYQSRHSLIHFGFQWKDAHEAQNWARQILNSKNTCAIAGSQIYADQTVVFPIGLIQMARFVQNRSVSRRMPEDVQSVMFFGPYLRGHRMTTNEIIDVQLFKREVELLLEYMNNERYQHTLSSVCFMERPLTATFAQHFEPSHQRQYTDLIQRILDLSEEKQIPVVSFIRWPQAMDLVGLLKAVNLLHENYALYDTDLFSSQMGWGDCSQFYICARLDDVLDDYYERICFAYLKTAVDSPPVRIELPSWVIDSGYGDWIMDIVRAECLSNIDYAQPLVIDKASSLAEITSHDKVKFFKMIKTFCDKHELSLLDQIW